MASVCVGSLALVRQTTRTVVLASTHAEPSCMRAPISVLDGTCVSVTALGADADAAGSGACAIHVSGSNRPSAENPPSPFGDIDDDMLDAGVCSSVMNDGDDLSLSVAS